MLLSSGILGVDQPFRNRMIFLNVACQPCQDHAVRHNRVESFNLRLRHRALGVSFEMGLLPVTVEVQ